MAATKNINQIIADGSGGGTASSGTGAVSSSLSKYRAPGLSTVPTALVSPGQAMAGNVPGTGSTAGATAAAPATVPVATTPTASTAGSAAAAMPATPAAGSTSTRTVTPESPATAENLRGAEDQSALLEELYAAQQKAALAALEREYNAKTAALDQEAEAIPGYYYEAARQAAGLSAQESRALNERNAAAGLGSGAAAQTAIAQSNVKQSSLNAIELEKAKALSDIETQRQTMAAEYESLVREAVLNNELEKAQALYEEAVRVDESMVNTALQQAALNANARSETLSAAETKAKTLAAIGDYSGYAALGYSPEEIAALEKAYQQAAAPTSTGTYSGGTAAPEDTPAVMDYEGLFKAAQASGYPAAFLAQKANYQKYGFSSSSGLSAAYDDWLAAGGGTTAADTAGISMAPDSSRSLGVSYKTLKYADLSDAAKNISGLMDSDLTKNYDRVLDMIQQLGDEDEQNYLLKQLEAYLNEVK